MFLQRLILALLGAALVACSSAPDQPDPTPLQEIQKSSVSVKLAWQAQLGEGAGELRPKVAQGRLALASANGTVQVRDPKTGAVIWESSRGKRLVAGVGFDGRVVATVDADNVLTAEADGQILWQSRLNARTFTPPFVAGGRVFVVTAEREVQAFDADNGVPLWTHKYAGEALVLQSPTMLGAYGQDLVAGLGENLVAIRPNDGQAFWSVALTRPRGVNEIERLSDVVAGAHASQGLLCARAFQASVACATILTGNRAWMQEDDGSTGIAGDDEQIFGVDRSGAVKAWALTTGQLRWQQSALRFRDVTAPLSLGLTLAVGDGQGYVHWLSKDNGAVLARVATDGSAITAPPILFNQTLIVLTASGGIFAWQPQ